MREKVSREIREEMNARAEQFHIILDGLWSWIMNVVWENVLFTSCLCYSCGADVSITHLTFGQEFTQAIEAKQVAYQEAERSKFVVMKAEQEKKVHFAPSLMPTENECENCSYIPCNGT